jgi:hypothetical protein
MYHKMKNTLAGLGIVAAFFTGGLLMSEPVPAEVAAPQIEAPEAALALAVVKLALDLSQSQALSTVQAEAAEAAHKAKAEARQRASRVRLELGMPYYSFGTALPRRRES